MDYNRAKQLLHRTLDIDKQIAGEKNRLTPMLWGGAGVGKSSMVKEVAAELGYELREIRLSTLSPVDVRGVPWVPQDNPEHFKFVPPPFMPTGEEKQPVLLFFDEINTAPPLNQVVAYEISLDRKMGGHPLPPNTLVVMAGNRVQDRGATFEMPMPLANRLVHIEVESHEDIFLEYGVKKNLPEGLLAFIKFKPALLNRPSDGKEYAFPTPRSWESAARFIANNAEMSDVAAVIGKGTAAELFEFLKLRNVLPNLDQILETGEIFKHTQIDVMYFYTIAISNRLMRKIKEAKKEEQQRFITNYIKALSGVSQEMQACGLACIKNDPIIIMYMGKNRTLFNQVRSALE